MSTTFPTSRPALRDYFGVAIAYVNETSNKTRLQINAGKLTALLGVYGDATTADTYLYYYTKWSDESGGRTKQVTDNLDALEINLKKKLTEIYDDIPATLWTTNDRDTLRRKTGLPKTYSVPITSIEEQCFVSVKPLGGGDYKFRCRSAEDSSRSSKPENADAVEVAGRTDPPNPKYDDQNPELAGIPRYYKMLGPGDGTQIQTFTKAIFTENLKAENAGSQFQFYARWTNTKHPNLAGPWTGPYSFVIS